jgi:uncharacterized membrane protein
MVLFEQLDGGDCAFTVRPNCALGWAWMKWVFGGITGCVVLVAAYFAALGAWLVLPFAGLEVGVLGYAVYQNARAAAAREVILLRAGDLTLYRGGRTLSQVARLPRYWTRLSLVRDPTGWYPTRVLLECHGRRIEVAGAVVERERRQLAAELRRRLGFEAAFYQAPAETVPAGLDAAGQKI